MVARKISGRGFALAADSAYALWVALFLLGVMSSYSIYASGQRNLVFDSLSIASGDVLRASCLATVGESAPQSSAIRSLAGEGKLSSYDYGLSVCQLLARLQREGTAQSLSAAANVSSELFSSLVPPGARLSLSVGGSEIYGEGWEGAQKAVAVSKAQVYSHGAAGPYEDPFGPVAYEVRVWA
jgi:hypothetical protein